MRTLYAHQAVRTRHDGSLGLPSNRCDWRSVIQAACGATDASFFLGGEGGVRGRLSGKTDKLVLMRPGKCAANLILSNVLLLPTEDFLHVGEDSLLPGKDAMFIPRGRPGSSPLQRWSILNLDAASFVSIWVTVV